MITNRKPVDELADVRERIKDLKQREEELRDMLLAGAGDLIGDDYAAKISVVKSERVDLPQLRKELGSQFLAPFMVPQEQTKVTVQRIKGED